MDEEMLAKLERMNKLQSLVNIASGLLASGQKNDIIQDTVFWYNSLSKLCNMDPDKD